MVAESKFKDWEWFLTLPGRLHRSAGPCNDVWFRNIKIKEM
jgi:hypothetical protein